MTLKEKFFNWYPKQDAEFISEECEKIADEFAIEFAEWICLKADVPYIKGTMDNTLEIFKKEKGL